MSAAPKFANLPVADIRIGENVRIELRDIDKLTASVRARGVRTPITVVPDEDGTGAEVLTGFRRLEAAKRAGLKTIPCVLQPRPRRSERVVDQLTENLQRSDMTPLELALAYKDLIDAGMTLAAIGKMVGYTETWVKRTLTLLNMPECVQQAAHAGVIPATKATNIPSHLLAQDGAVERLCALIAEHGKLGLAEWYRGEYDNARLAADERARAYDEQHGLETFNRATGRPVGLSPSGALPNKATAAKVAPGTWKLTLFMDIALRNPVLKAAADAGLTIGEYVTEAIDQRLDFSDAPKPIP